LARSLAVKINLVAQLAAGTGLVSQKQTFVIILDIIAALLISTSGNIVGFGMQTGGHFGIPPKELSNISGLIYSQATCGNGFGNSCCSGAKGSLKSSVFNSVLNSIDESEFGPTKLLK
jgi:hypothetical protein